MDISVRGEHAVYTACDLGVFFVYTGLYNKILLYPVVCQKDLIFGEIRRHKIPRLIQFAESLVADGIVKLHQKIQSLSAFAGQLEILLRRFFFFFERRYINAFDAKRSKPFCSALCLGKSVRRQRVVLIVGVGVSYYFKFLISPYKKGQKPMLCPIFL